MGIAVQLMGRTDDQIGFRFLSIALANRNHRQILKRLRQPPRQFPAPPAAAPPPPPPADLAGSRRRDTPSRSPSFPRRTPRRPRRRRFPRQDAQLIGKCALIGREGIIQPLARIQRLAWFRLRRFCRFAHQHPGKADAPAAAGPALAPSANHVGSSFPHRGHRIVFHLPLILWENSKLSYNLKKFFIFSFLLYNESRGGTAHDYLLR